MITVTLLWWCCSVDVLLLQCFCVVLNGQLSVQPLHNINKTD